MWPAPIVTTASHRGSRRPRPFARTAASVYHQRPHRRAATRPGRGDLGQIEPRRLPEPERLDNRQRPVCQLAPGAHETDPTRSPASRRSPASASSAANPPPAITTRCFACTAIIPAFSRASSPGCGDMWSASVGLLSHPLPLIRTAVPCTIHCPHGGSLVVSTEAWLDAGRERLARLPDRGRGPDTRERIGELPRGRGVLGVLIATRAR